MSFKKVIVIVFSAILHHREDVNTYSPVPQRTLGINNTRIERIDPDISGRTKRNTKVNFQKSEVCKTGILTNKKEPLLPEREL